MTLEAAGTPAPAATGAAAPAGTPAGADPAAGGTAGAQAGQPGAPGSAPGTEGQPAPEPTDDFTDRERAFLTALQEERGKRQETETRMAEFERNQQGQARPAAPAPAAAAPTDPLSQIDDDSLMTGADVKNLIQTGIMPMFQQLATSLAMIQRGQQHPDMNEAVTTYLPQVLQADPAVGQALQQVQGPARMILAHALGSLMKKATGGGAPAGAPPANPGNGGGQMDLGTLAAQILANVAKPGPAGAAGSAAMQNVADMLRAMTPEQFDKYQADLKRSWQLQGIGT